MQIFLSKSTNKIDEKGRVSIPAAFRKVFEAEKSSMVFLMPSLLGLPALDGMTEASAMRIAASLGDSVTDKVEYALRMAALGETHPLPMDQTGRVVIPDDLRETAHLRGDFALLIGLGHTFQIWDPAVFEQHREGIRQTALDHGDRLRLKPMGAA